MSSTISDGERLSRAVTWRASIRPPGNIAKVDFLVDGKQVWEEENAPYFFNDDDQLLAPWLLGTGKHALAVEATTSSGKMASTVAHVTVTKVPRVPAPLVGSFSRTVTPKDFSRESSMQGYDADALPPTGRWTMHISPKGLISFDDPVGTGQKEILAASNSAVTLFGPASWLAPEDRRGGFCEPAPVDRTYRWRSSGTTLMIRGGSNCPQRIGVMDGKWTRSS